MAATIIAVQSIALTGIVPAFTAATAPATGGDKFLNDGRTYVEVINGSGAPINVLVDSLVNCNQGHDHNITVAVANGARKKIGPFPQAIFNDASGYCTVTTSLETTITLGAFSLAS